MEEGGREAAEPLMTTHVFAPQLKREGKRESSIFLSIVTPRSNYGHISALSLFLSFFYSPPLISFRSVFFSFASKAVLSAISHYLVSV